MSGRWQQATSRDRRRNQPDRQDDKKRQRNENNSANTSRPPQNPFSRLAASPDFSELTLSKLQSEFWQVMRTEGLPPAIADRVTLFGNTVGISPWKLLPEVTSIDGIIARCQLVGTAEAEKHVGKKVVIVALNAIPSAPPHAISTAINGQFTVVPLSQFDAGLDIRKPASFATVIDALKTASRTTIGGDSMASLTRR